MAAHDNDTQKEPRGLGEHTRGLASEYAHEQGWQLNEEQRTRQPAGKQNTDGGTDYEYGARDFGDEPVDTAPLASEDKVAKAREALTKE
ncbi:hypothetical protein Terro_2581 [Terriglobus roseus DSM 18391]|uniref:Uncharacterized protein n=1 Tax=Terriglobus roseus (strain DSM 18391 / NRRL B-41598 / KBS 63) TaxID=926566 RepID=I3ZGW4_TERRK|nr:hypothetical protein [Terriglobus roseus]AFL88482.1 hypothetical protein Terro_2217 [Terriglobus roseus DSM 18391]AFL88823.1 hypothetical protein Terro_2581 [Terriglobus roseus DSM 18391]